MRLFLLDWIIDYIETPEIQQTPGQEVLFYAALAIIFGIVLGVIFIGALIYEKLKK